MNENQETTSPAADARHSSPTSGSADREAELVQKLANMGENLFRVLPLDMIRELRNELIYITGYEYEKWGIIWINETALMECNARLMVGK